MKLKALLTEYNWLISALIVIIGTPVASMLQSGQPLTFQGVLIAVIPAAINYYTTHSAETVGTATGKEIGKAEAVKEITNNTTNF